MTRNSFEICTLAVASVLLAACGSQDENARWSAEKAISGMLKDPSSARFSDVFLVEAKETIRELIKRAKNL